MHLPPLCKHAEAHAGTPVSFPQAALLALSEDALCIIHGNDKEALHTTASEQSQRNLLAALTGKLEPCHTDPNPANLAHAGQTVCIRCTMLKYAGHTLLTWLAKMRRSLLDHCSSSNRRKRVSLKVGQVRIGNFQEGDDCVPSPPPLACLLVQPLSHLYCSLPVPHPPP